MAYNQYDLNATSLVKTGILTEMYIPLWWYSSGSTSVSGGGSAYIQKGSASMTTSTTGSAVKLHSLNPNWSANQKFALEASMYTTNATNACTVSLYDITSSTTVSGSTISTTATTATVMRSGQFTLTPGHTYGIVVTGTTTSISSCITKASLIAFLS